MSALLIEYEKRLSKRDIDADPNIEKKDFSFENLKFKANGEIKPYFGLTCIVWIDPKTKLYKELVAYQGAVKKALEKAGLVDFFCFLDPKPFHMTICDIVASPMPIQSEKARVFIDKIGDAFSRTAKTEAIHCQVNAVGLATTLSALVRFEENELLRVLALEQRLKDAAQVNLRNFTGHISLAYLVSAPGNATGKIREILRAHKRASFGNLTFSQFDLTSFTDMNTYIPLLSIDFEENQITQY
ncbi:MAG: DUF1868 domain-containing protein [Anaerolineae bacterium]|jgi:hypothetical protein|nr:DUF1868 domain-containing protein [Anaerolineae bacterium]MBT3714756.1 DUF1868 domain-containing protein [Anaerolineae bacterium]MBT4311133.1 DUF1868 domain-containing protein [Anaerolineae bacterium]MBT4457580.1 DUF1868 domain-containing protein [Anaerolineae bacterium]MBT4841747.1 DUF1868 domain-containing protein [Anaerolineae bacterium]